MTDDTLLLRRYHEEGSEAAFAELVRRHIDLVYTVALRKVDGDSHRAQEAVQIVFTDFARKAHTLLEHPVLSAWLFKSAHFAAANLRRTERRRELREQEGFVMQQLLSDSTPPADWDALRPVIDDALNELNDRDREAVMLRFFHGLEFPALGVRLNLSAEGARARVDRATDKLHAALSRRGVTSTAAAVSAVLGKGALTAAPAGLAATVATAALTAAGTLAVGTATTAATATFWIAAVKLPLAAVTAAVVVGAIAYQARSDQNKPSQASGPQTAQLSPTPATAAPITAPSPAVAAATATATAAIVPPPSAETDPAVIAGDEYLAKNPVAKDLLAQSQRARIAGLYFPLYLELGLDDVQAAAFEEIMSSNGAGGSYGAGMVGPTKLTLRPFPKLPLAEREARLRALLGDTGFVRFKTYEDSNLAPAMQVASSLYFTDTPLTTDQATQLTAIFAALKDRHPGYGHDPRVFWSAVVERASAVLRPDQMSPLAAMRAESELGWMRRIAAAPAAASGTPPPVSLEAHLDQNANHPAIQVLALATQRAQLAENYGPFFRAHHLDTHQTAQLTDLLARRLEQHEDLEQVARRQPGTRFTTVKAEHARTEADFDAAVAALLGADARAQFRDYERSRPARSFIGKLAGIAAVSGIPFTSPQADQLTQLLANASPPYVAGGMTTFTDIDWAAFEASAAPILSRHQYRLIQRADVTAPRSRWQPQLSKVLMPKMRPSAPDPWR